MFLILNIFLLTLHVSVQHLQKFNWDLAVTNNNGIMVLTSNGTFLDVTTPYSYLKALTYDNLQRTFIVSDMNDGNDTIYPISLENPQTEHVLPIIKNVSDDIQNLAFDPTSMTVYWADTIQKSIKFIPLQHEQGMEPKILVQFVDKEPQHVVIHSCARHLFFTNSIYTKPTIERIDLLTKEHEIIIDTDLITPVGITIDYLGNRLYWSDWGPGIYFRIESANLDGKDREVIIEDTYQQPFGLAVDTDFIYWTDITSNTLYKAYKKNPSYNKNRFYPIRTFKEEPRGILSNYLGFAGTPSCATVENLLSKFNTCLNNRKESTCENYCLHEECNITDHGTPECHCHSGYFGVSHKSNICDKI